MRSLILNIPTCIKVFLVTAFALFSIHCGSSVKVQFDYIEGQDFSSFRTFDFISQPADLKVHDKPVRRVKNSVINELESNGFEMRFTQPDFLIAVQTSVNAKVDINSWGYSYAPYDLYHGGYGYWGVPTMNMYQYEEGTLVIDIIDPKTMTLIWRGVAQRALPPKPDADRIQEIIDEAVRRVLYYWPPD
jgi:hypothetical protein